MRNDEGHQCYIKVHDIFREIFDDRTCNIPDVQDRIAKAVAEGSSKKKFLKKGREIGFHLMDWHGDAKFLIALSLFPERFTNAEIRQGVIWFLNHAGYHIPEARSRRSLQSAPPRVTYLKFKVHHFGRGFFSSFSGWWQAVDWWRRKA